MRLYNILSLREFFTVLLYLHSVLRLSYNSPQKACISADFFLIKYKRTLVIKLVSNFLCSFEVRKYERSLHNLNTTSIPSTFTYVKVSLTK